MALSFEPVVRPSFVDLCAEDEALCRRIRAEYLEMPGLTLTLPQAARLFSIDMTRCGRLLDALVASGFLVARGKTAQAQGKTPQLRWARSPETGA